MPKTAFGFSVLTWRVAAECTFASGRNSLPYASPHLVGEESELR
jgi:hypothetical protein